MSHPPGARTTPTESDTAIATPLQSTGEGSSWRLTNASEADRGTIRVLIIAGFPAVRAGLTALLSLQTDILPIEIFPSPGDEEIVPDVILADAGSSSEATLDDLADTFPGAAFVVIGGDPSVDGPGLGGGAVGYLSSEVDTVALAMAVRGVAAGLTVIDPALIATTGIHAHSPSPSAIVTSPGEALTSREREVLELVAAGLPNKAIARELGISEHTAKFHVGSLLSKLGAGSRTEAVTLATRRGILSV